MKKIGIMTFHRAVNCGAVLQAYALQKYLIGRGADVKIVDYRCPSFETQHSPVRKSGSLSNKISSLIESGRTKAKIARFEKFQQERLITTAPAFTTEELEKLCEDFDVLITGSDQVFDPVITRMQPDFFLGFRFGGTRLSYAASRGTAQTDHDIEEKYRSYLHDYSAVSVRERSLFNYLEGILGSDSSKLRIDPDPVLLADRAIWEKMLGNSERLCKKPYVVVYSVQKASARLMEQAKKKSEELGAELIVLNFFLKERMRQIGKAKAGLDGPEEMVHYIRDAEYVFTNSFHGTAFAVTFRKNFALDTAYAGGRNLRSAELMTFLELENRDMAGSCFDISENISESQWQTAQTALDGLRKKTDSYFDTFIFD